jgi:hypothetical protein
MNHEPKYISNLRSAEFEYVLNSIKVCPIALESMLGEE